MPALAPGQASHLGASVPALVPVRGVQPWARAVSGSDAYVCSRAAGPSVDHVLRQAHGPAARSTTVHAAASGAAAGGAGRLRVPVKSPTFKVQLLQPDTVRESGACDKLMVYFPGTDGTGQAILPQVPGVRSLGYDVWCLYIPPDDRSDWDQLTTQATLLLRQLLDDWQEIHMQAPVYLQGQAPPRPRITLVAESFGCCLALRVAASAAGPELLEQMVLVNPATAFARSLNGLSSLIAATNLLSLFPKDMYSVAQATLLPLLVDSSRVDDSNAQLLRRMIEMDPPASRQAFAFSARSSQGRLPAGGGAGAWQTSSVEDSDADALAATNGPAGAAGIGRVRLFNSADDGSAPAAAAFGGVFHAPAGAANFRTNLLRDGDLAPELLARVTMPVLLITSARDRMLPAITEGARLQHALPNAKRMILPDSGHAALLERDISLSRIMVASGFDGTRSAASAAGSSATVRAVGGSGNGNGVSAPAPPPGAWANGAGGAQPQAAATALGSRAGENGNATEGTLGYVGSVQGSGRWQGTAYQAASNGGSSGSTGASASSAAAGSNAAGRARKAGGELAEAGNEPAGSNGGADKETAFDEWCQKLVPWRDLVSPVVLGFDNLPAPGTPEFGRPMLFVSNHQRMGFYDTPLLVYELYVRGYKVRGLAHPGHWSGPFGPWFEQFGTVKASPMAAFRLLRNKEKVLLFPGGAKEVVKKRGQDYTLLWKDSPDFVRLAARCNALIVPCAAVGADDAYDVVMDTEEVLANPLLGTLARTLLQRVDVNLDPAESIFPITRLPGVGLPTPIPIPNLQRLYFKFGKPVDTAGLARNINDAARTQELYDSIRVMVEQMMAELLEVRANDEDNQVGPRLSNAMKRLLPVLGASNPENSDAE